MCSTKWHGTKVKVDFVAFMHFIAMLLYVTKWHGTSTGAHFVKTSLKSVSHEVARDYDKSTLREFKEDEKDMKKLLITTGNSLATTKTGIGSSCPRARKNAIREKKVRP